MKGRFCRLCTGYCLIALVFVLPMSGICTAAEFAADTITNHAGGTFTGKTYIKGDKIRSEGVKEGRNTISIHRMDKGITWILMPENKTYMEMSGVTGWNMEEMEKAAQEMAEKKNLGTETVNGYLCDKFQYVYKDKSLGVVTQWIARDLKYPIKTEHTGMQGYSMKSELTNIKTQSLPDSLFELPAGYTKMNIPGRSMHRNAPRQ
ncbi:MAG: DUF4412 domain-containing protein [Deltaproteobacteria bacterium]|nr:DUF4412 domain-containing protein [Deltaproteobacteria bacterium]